MPGEITVSKLTNIHNSTTYYTAHWHVTDQITNVQEKYAVWYAYMLRFQSDKAARTEHLNLMWDTN